MFFLVCLHPLVLMGLKGILKSHGAKNRAPKKLRWLQGPRACQAGRGSTPKVRGTPSLPGLTPPQDCQT